MTTRSLLIETEDYAGVFLVRMNLYFLLWFFTFIFFMSCVRAANAAALSIQKMKIANTVKQNSVFYMMSLPLGLVSWTNVAVR